MVKSARNRFSRSIDTSFRENLVFEIPPGGQFVHDESACEL